MCFVESPRAWKKSQICAFISIFAPSIILAIIIIFLISFYRINIPVTATGYCWCYLRRTFHFVCNASLKLDRDNKWYLIQTVWLLMQSGLKIIIIAFAVELRCCLDRCMCTRISYMDNAIPTTTESHESVETSHLGKNERPQVSETIPGTTLCLRLPTHVPLSFRVLPVVLFLTSVEEGPHLCMSFESDPSNYLFISHSESVTVHRI